MGKIVVSELKFVALGFREQSITEVKIYSLIVAGLALVGSTVAGIRQVLFSMLGEHTSRAIKVKTFERILKMPVSWFEK